jgi:hypothetical protein
VVDAHLLGDIGNVSFDERLDDTVFVLGVGVEELVHVSYMGGEGGAGHPIARISLSRGDRQREQFAPDALVDVAVEVEGDVREASQDGVGVDDGHGEDRATSGPAVLLKGSYPNAKNVLLVFDSDLTAFLESGCSTIVGVLGPSGEPFATRGWGTEVLSDAVPRLRLLVSAGAFASIGRRAGDGDAFAIALTGADVRTLRSVQVKGTAHDLEPPTAADLERSEAFCTAFFADVQAVDGIGASLMRRLVPSDLLACTVAVAELYDQTPGPGAGAPLGAR